MERNETGGGISRLKQLSKSKHASKVEIKGLEIIIGH